MKLLMFGKSGQVAQEVLRRAGSVTVEALDRAAADLDDPAACGSAVATTDAEAVLIAAAYTAVDRAELEGALADTVNGAAPGAIAAAAAARGLPVILYSTDYVFDGSGHQPWSVDSPTAPLGAYGRSKLAGEKAVRGAGGPHAILRTSWVVSAHGANFVKTMLRLGRERDRLTIVADQIGGPTPAAALADAGLRIAAALIADPGKSGTYHLGGAPDASWADFAREIFRQAGIDCQVEDIPTSAYPTPAKRPLNSRLDTSLTEATFGIARPDWRIGLKDILQDLGATVA